jgi:hypothetical protein
MPLAAFHCHDDIAMLSLCCRNRRINIANLKREILSMRKILLAAVALAGLTALGATGASAAPSAAGVHVVPSQPAATNVNYYWHHRHWHHRRWHHGHWHYWG